MKALLGEAGQSGSSFCRGSGEPPSASKEHPLLPAPNPSGLSRRTQGRLSVQSAGRGSLQLVDGDVPSSRGVTMEPPPQGGRARGVEGPQASGLGTWDSLSALTQGAVRGGLAWGWQWQCVGQMGQRSTKGLLHPSWRRPFLQERLVRE